MSWLIRDGDVLAAIETCRASLTDPFQGALVVERPTLLTRVPLDIAWCDRELQVRRIGVLRPYRVTLPRVRLGCLVVASPGSFDRWRLRVGDHLEITG